MMMSIRSSLSATSSGTLQVPRKREIDWPRYRMRPKINHP